MVAQRKKKEKQTKKQFYLGDYWAFQAGKATARWPVIFKNTVRHTQAQE